MCLIRPSQFANRFQLALFWPTISNLLILKSSKSATQTIYRTARCLSRSRIPGLVVPSPWLGWRRGRRNLRCASGFRSAIDYCRPSALFGSSWQT